MTKPTIDLNTAHDVRRLCMCARCGHIGDCRYMPKIDGGFLLHGHCAWAQLGLAGIIKLPRAEISKLTLKESGPDNMRALVDALAAEKERA